MLKNVPYKRRSFSLNLIGSVLLLLSNTSIVFVKFGGFSRALGRPFIMITYFFAQYFISKGALNHILAFELGKQDCFQLIFFIRENLSSMEYV
mgnify:FL=1